MSHQTRVATMADICASLAIHRTGRHEHAGRARRENSANGEELVRSAYAASSTCRSGRSCQCAPDRTTHSTPVAKGRLSEPVRPGCPAFPGAAIRLQCASFSSYRFVAIHQVAAKSRIPMNHAPSPMGILADGNTECRSALVFVRHDIIIADAVAPNDPCDNNR